MVSCFDVLKDTKSQYDTLDINDYPPSTTTLNMDNNNYDYMNGKNDDNDNMFFSEISKAVRSEKNNENINNANTNFGNFPVSILKNDKEPLSQIENNVNEKEQKKSGDDIYLENIIP